MPGTEITVWATCPVPDAQARCRMFCLPYAGAGASIYRAWPAALRGVAEVWPVHLPGRERRLSDAHIDTVQDLAKQLALGIASNLNHPFVLFGHSMGALISFEVTRALRHLGLPRPCALLVSGYGGPHLPDTRPPIHALPDPDFVDAVAALDGTPKDVIENQELMALLLPLLRADFKLVETYRCLAEAPLDVPIHVYSGRTDRDTPLSALQAWSECTTEAVSITQFDGGHFYLRDQARALMDRICRDVRALSAPRSDQMQTARL